MFYAVCTSCGRSYEYSGATDNKCPACWVNVMIYCPHCYKYFEVKPSKICPYCQQPLTKKAAT